jgi:hypothetical protein
MGWLSALGAGRVRWYDSGGMRFPYTFMGIVSLTIALFVVAYLAAHRSLDPIATLMALAAAAVAFGFGIYVLVRRVFRGREA